MALSRDEIIEQLQSLVGAEFVLTDLETMQLSSVDRFRRYEAYHDVFSMPLPAAVVKAQSTQQVADIIAFANRNKVNVVARTGGSATEGGLETAIENSIVLDGSAMNNIINIDVENMQVTAQCGTSLQELDDKLRTMGYSTGHSPQSKPLAQMGGLVATRSIGQFSTLYGGIEDMVVGLEAVFPEGGITRIKNVPRRAAGPDIRHVVIGNEGALCFITEVTVKIFKYYPDNNRYLGY
ncbi:MAG: alkyldihydroxyacetonephosphate synthase, partial [Arenicella sp.]